MAASAAAPTGTIRSFAPLPQTRTSPVARSTRSASSPASSASRNPDEYASSNSARSRTASGSSPGISTRRTASSGDSADGSLLTALGAFSPAQGFSFSAASRSCSSR